VDVHNRYGTYLSGGRRHVHRRTPKCLDQLDQTLISEGGQNVILQRKSRTQYPLPSTMAASPLKMAFRSSSCVAAGSNFRSARLLAWLFLLFWCGELHRVQTERLQCWDALHV